VNTLVETTLPEKILLAAAQLEDAGQSPFSAEALIVAAWQANPRTFGLKGYADQYPDSNKVLSGLMGERGLTKRGLLAKMGQKLYALTREGKTAVRRLHEEATQTEPITGSRPLSPEQETFLLTALGTIAVQKFRAGTRADITFPDACRYWNLTDGVSGDLLDRTLDQFRLLLREIESRVGFGQADLSSGQIITADEIEVLSDLDSYLDDRFTRHLILLRSRGNRR
jgi:hypothetical protein